MNYCRKCQSDYEKPGTCNCFAPCAPFPCQLQPVYVPMPYIPPPTVVPIPTPFNPPWTVTTTPAPTIATYVTGSAQCGSSGFTATRPLDPAEEGKSWSYT